MAAGYGLSQPEKEKEARSLLLFPWHKRKLRSGDTLGVHIIPWLLLPNQFKRNDSICLW
jgi:hypothetical protein